MDQKPANDSLAQSPGDQPAGRLRSDLSFEPQRIGSQLGYMCRDLARGEYFRFGEREYELALLFDGSNTFEDIARKSQGSRYESTEEQVQRLAWWLGQHKLLDLRAHPRTPPTDTSWIQSIAQTISIRLPLVDAAPIARRLDHSIGWLFSVAGLACWVAVVLLATALLSINSARFSNDLQRVFDPSSWIWLMIVWCVIKVIHEAGHALAASRQGIVVGRGGIIVLLFAPIAYVDVTDSWRLKNTWSRVQIALAGVYLELLVASIAVLVWVAYPSNALVTNLCVNIILTAGPTTLLVNANPLMRLDGYFALSDMLRIPNLAMHGSRQLAGWAEWLMLGRSRPPSMLTGWRSPLATCYAVAAIIYKSIWMIGLLLLVATYFSGLGVVPAMIAFTLWVVFPLARWIKKLLSAPDRGPALRRLAECGLIIGMLVCALMYIPSPIGQRVPVVVTYKQQTAIHTRSAGFVDKVMVHSGETVTTGQPLIQLRNPQLELQLAELKIDIEGSQIRYRQLVRQDQHGLSQGELQRLDSLRARCAELKMQLDEQVLVASNSGVIITPNLDRLENTYAESGDVLIEIGQTTEKEMVASIAQDQVVNYQAAAANEQDATVRVRGGQHMTVRLSRCEPRGSTRLPHPGFAAVSGGSIPVQQRENGETEMSEPRFEAYIEIPQQHAVHLRSGQRGMLNLKDRRTIYELLRDRLSAYWTNASAALREWA